MDVGAASGAALLGIEDGAAAGLEREADEVALRRLRAAARTGPCWNVITRPLRPSARRTPAPARGRGRWWRRPPPPRRRAAHQARRPPPPRPRLRPRR